MNYAKINKTDIANGPGVRVSLFVSGCTHHCKGCFNEVAWDFNYGNKYTEEIENEILNSLKPDYISGITILGGEPFENNNIKTVCDLLIKVVDRYPDKTIWIYSGYTIEELINDNSKFSKYKILALKLADVLVDGEFHIEEKDISLQFRGSRNQRIIDLFDYFNK